MVKRLIHFITRPGAKLGLGGILASLLTFCGYKLVRKVVRKWLG